MPLPPLSFKEARRILRELHELTEQHRIIVIGGQAIALWYRELSRRGYLPAELVAPLTSKDIDFRGADHAPRVRAEARQQRDLLPHLLPAFIRRGSRTGKCWAFP